MCVDVARGTLKDYSAFIIYDVTQLPYKVVATFRDNEIKPILFPEMIAKVCTQYNKAHILVEVNDIGLKYQMVYILKLNMTIF